MLYDWNDNNKNSFPNFPRRVAGADGKEYEYVVKLDTETGELTRLARSNGKFVMDEAAGRLVRVCEVAELPVTLEF